MQRIQGFLFGIVAGVALTFVVMKYHVIRGADGFHFVPRTTADLGSIYTDIREFKVEDWQNHQDLAMAISKSDVAALQQDAVTGALSHSAEGVWKDLTGN